MRHGRPPQILRSVIALLTLAVLTVGASSVAGVVSADPAADALARMAELSRQAEQASEELYSAELDLDLKVEAQRAAEEKLAEDLGRAEAASADLRSYQAAVDRVAVAEYVSGPSGNISATLGAGSPQELLDRLSVQRVMSGQMRDAMTQFSAARTRAAAAEDESRVAAAQARAATDATAKVRADIQRRQGDLRTQISSVEAQYAALTTEQRAVLAAPGPPPPSGAAPPPPSDIVAMPNPDGAVPGPPAGTGGGAAVVQTALSRVGSPYVWGGNGPNAFDCSGLIKWSFLQQGKSLPRSSQALASGGQPVALEALLPGDIVTFYSDASHAGIYIGDGMMVHASTYGTPVKVAPITMAPIYNARRY
ncbi:peptidoglycan hydrolase RipC [Mycobacterium sp. pW049]